MSNIERNKAKISLLCMVISTSRDDKLRNSALEDLVALAHGLNNSLANTQAILEEATEHCEELQERLDKGY